MEEVNNFARVLPRPRPKHTRSVNSVGNLVVVEEGVEVLVRKTTHGSPESTHLQLGLVVHLADQLLSVLQLHLELNSLVSVQVRTLLNKKTKVSIDCVAPS